MTEIFVDGVSFTDICKEASLIKGFKRESYIVRYKKEDKAGGP